MFRSATDFIALVMINHKHTEVKYVFNHIKVRNPKNANLLMYVICHRVAAMNQYIVM